MKKILATIMSLTMVFSFAACGNENDGTTASAKPVEIEFMQWWATENGGDYLSELITNFAAENPNIKIKLTSLQFGDTHNQIVASQATKTVPDVIGMNPPWTREFYDLGILAPLDDLMAADESYNKDDYYQASFTPIEGKTYLAPVNSMAFFLFYNKTMFTDAGLTPPTTWQEIVDDAKKLTDEANNK